MAWIEMIAEERADAKLASLYESAKGPGEDRVDNILRIHSLHPAGLTAHVALYGAVMRGTPTLPRVDREMIALEVSRLNACHYWIAHHRRGLRRLLRDDALAERIERDPETAGLDPRRLAMLRYAAKLTRTPASVAEADVQGLRDVGFGDADILAIAEVAAYYAYANRIADGLGVELEDEAETN